MGRGAGERLYVSKLVVVRVGGGEVDSGFAHFGFLNLEQEILLLQELVGLSMRMIVCERIV